MDPRFTGYMDELKFDDEFSLPNSDQCPYTTTNGSKFEYPPLYIDSVEPALEVPPISSISWSPEADPFLSNDSDSDPILKFISQMLMEETVDENPFLVQGSSSLQATQKSLNDVLGGNHHPSTDPYSVDETLSLDDIFSGSASSADHQWLGYLEDYQTSPPGDQMHQPSPNSLVGSSINEFLVQNIFSEKESVLQFQRGLEEARKFLPSAPESNSFSSALSREVKNETRGRKNHEREDLDLAQGRSNKQPALYTDDSKLSEMFDQVLLFGEKDEKHPRYDEVALQNEVNKNLRPTGTPKGGKSRAKKQGKKTEAVDFMTLLMLCAQAVSSDDRRTANELLKQIRQHSSPSGDGPQRLAHYFGNSLEARLAGTGTAPPSFYNSVASKRISVVDVLKAFHLHLSTCPFRKFAMAFANRTILNLAEKATTVTIHVVDFGIGYGFQWPSLIQHLSYQSGGPPRLRITGIDLPQPGFRPTEGIEAAGHRLAHYCERFKVPFEYNVIASQKWETIKLDELKIDKKDTLVVNCLFRSQHLFDETVEENSPRDAVLSLIKEMKPDVFIHSIVTGSYNTPFFITRFREALFHHSAMFDVFDSTVSREDEGRLLIEREIYGREAMNVISCEGSERIERPETYKQWQVRSMNAGFRQLELDQNLVKKLKAKLKLYGYHKDFVLDEDSNWVLQGWKGRIISASSCWEPIQE